MPVTFDFTTNAAAFSNPLSWVEDGVTFTLSHGPTSGGFFVGVGGPATGTGRLQLSNSSGSLVQTFLLEFSDGAGNKTLTGPVTAITTNLKQYKAPDTTTGHTFKWVTTGGNSFVGKDGAAFTTGNVSGIRFSIPAGDRVVHLNTLSAGALACFCAGTMFETDSGPKPVEALSCEDHVLSERGQFVPVRWIGKRFVDTHLSHPKMVNPICITSGCFGEGLPHRDLFISADHALALDGLLINAGALVNGDTIYQVPDMPKEGFTYYHVETEAHELLLVEGCAAESFIDQGAYSLESFDNSDMSEDRPRIAELDMPRISSIRLVPTEIRQRLSQTAKAA